MRLNVSPVGLRAWAPQRGQRVARLLREAMMTKRMNSPKITMNSATTGASSSLSSLSATRLVSPLTQALIALTEESSAVSQSPLFSAGTM